MYGCGAGAALSLLDSVPIASQGRATHPAELSGTSFDLTIDRLPVNFTGRHAIASAVNGSVPGPTLRLREGDTVTIRVTNRLKTFSSIHWHGLRVPADMDGVPGLSFRGIAPGETFVYRFPVRQNGTYWYHSHSGFEEQTGLIGALVIEPRSSDPIAFDKDYVVLLSDWTDANPDTVYTNLKADSEYYNFHRRTVATFFSDVRAQGLRKTVADRLMWGRMNMSPTDISDVSGYTFLLNGNPPDANWTGLFRPGERIRLRFINGSSDTFFDVRIPGLSMTVVAADGNEVEPVTVDEFRMGVAEVYDVIVQPRDEKPYTIFAQAEDRSGYARGTLSPRPGVEGPIPRMDPRPERTMLDMGMGGMSGVPKMNDMPAMAAMQGMDMSSMHPEMTPANPSPEASDSTPAMTDMDSGFGTTPFPQPWTGTQRLMPASGTTEQHKPAPSSPVHLRIGPQVDTISKSTAERLSEPGAGLNGNGRKVLTYADLRARYRGVDGRPPVKEIELHLTGNMERFIWGFNGQKSSEAETIELKLGDRVRFVLVNDTMMEHPIHLHGLWSELENGQGEFNPYKHTVIVKPSERLSYLVSADTRGRWAYHCHLLYHMEAGMFRTVVVS
jgi:CopA family copper-resistance protein